MCLHKFEEHILQVQHIHAVHCLTVPEATNSQSVQATTTSALAQHKLNGRCIQSMPFAETSQRVLKLPYNDTASPIWAYQSYCIIVAGTCKELAIEGSLQVQRLQMCGYSDFAEYSIGTSSISSCVRAISAGDHLSLHTNTGHMRLAVNDICRLPQE